MITLPWPDPRLNPNKRVHYAQKARIAKKAREAACILACANVPLQARQAAVQGEGPISLAVTFYPPDRRKRDLDNMLASLKPALDGVADAFQADDYRFELTLRRADPVKLGKVEVEL